MRIITGCLKGRKLKSPIGNDIRPTTDKVKEAIFDLLYPYLFDGFVAVDLFAGSGNIGLEAVSRGAERVFFSDNSRQSLALVKENADYCKVSDKCVLLLGDFKRNIQRIKETVDFYFLDPPYSDGYILPALEQIDQSGNIAEEGIVVCEHSAKDKFPDKIFGFSKIKERKYGTICVTIYQRGDRDIES